MSINKQKHYVLINNEDDSIFVILKIIPTSNIEAVVSNIKFSENFIKYSNVNNDDEIQKVKLKLFGAEILGIDEEDFNLQLTTNYSEKLDEFNEEIQKRTNDFGLNKFPFCSGQNVKNLETHLNEFAENFNYTITT